MAHKTALAEQSIADVSRPRVLIIGPTPPPYNGMSMATDLVINSVRNAVSVIHLDTADRRGLSNIGKIDFRNVFLAAWHGLQYFTILLLKRPKIVYVPIAQDWLAFLRDSLFLVPARLLRKKLVVHLHGGHFGTFYQNSHAPMRWLVRFALSKSERAIVLGTILRTVFDGVIPSDRVLIVPNGIPDSFHDSATATSNGRRPTILFLSTLMKEKGTLDVIGALPGIVKEVPNVRVVFAGEWYRQKDKEAADALVGELDLRSHVDFIGTVEGTAKCDVLRNVDVFAIPTYNEGQPYAILEAMSAGLPVISTNVGCIPETVVEGESGFIVEPGNKEGLASKTALLLVDHDLRKRMGEASRKRFLELYTEDRFAAQMRAVFTELLQ